MVHSREQGCDPFGRRSICDGAIHVYRRTRTLQQHSRPVMQGANQHAARRYFAAPSHRRTVDRPGSSVRLRLATAPRLTYFPSQSAPRHIERRRLWSLEDVGTGGASWQSARKPSADNAATSSGRSGPPPPHHRSSTSFDWCDSPPSIKVRAFRPCGRQPAGLA